jgi:hypothetical protein
MEKQNQAVDRYIKEYPEYFDKDSSYECDEGFLASLEKAIQYIERQKDSCIKLNRRAPDRRWFVESNNPTFNFCFTKIKDGIVYFSMTPVEQDWETFNKEAYKENFNIQQNLITGFLEAIEILHQ